MLLYIGFVGFAALCLVVMILMGARLAVKPTWREALVSASGIACLLAMGGFLGAMSLLVGAFRSMVAAGRREEIASLVAAGFLVVGMVALAEAGLRAMVVQHSWGQEIGGMLLLPRGWHQVVSRYTKMLDAFDLTPNYFTADSLLGWKIGPNRSGRDGLWHSGREGVRTPSRGYSYTEGREHCRVVLLGDSFTFGWEESFEETMGFRLQERLRPDCQVLNIAVPGYSLAQMYLSAQRDVPSLQPSVVVLSFTDGAPERGLGVYCFLTMGDWGCPWAAPRFVVNHDRLELINVPLPPPREIYSYRAIHDLPFIRYDRGYRSSQWEQPYWEVLYSSYLFRVAATRFPPYDVPQLEVSEQAMAEVNEAILRSFIELMAKIKTPFLILYQPTKSDYGPDRTAPYSPDLLRRLNVEFIDGTSCLETLPLAQRFRMGGTHYSNEGEQALADCLARPIKQLLSSLPAGTGRHS